MGRRVVLGWWNAHQSFDVEAMPFRSSAKEFIGLRGIDPSLLRFVSGINLHKELWTAALLRHLPGDRCSDLGAVYRVDGIEQGHGFCGLVALKRSYEMQFDVIEPFTERRPLGHGFLHAIFTKCPVAFLQNGDDVGSIKCLAHHNQRHAFR